VLIPIFRIPMEFATCETPRSKMLVQAARSVNPCRIQGGQSDSQALAQRRSQIATLQQLAGVCLQGLDQHLAVLFE